MYSSPGKSYIEYHEPENKKEKKERKERAGKVIWHRLWPQQVRKRVASAVRSRPAGQVDDILAKVSHDALRAIGLNPERAHPRWCVMSVNLIAGPSILLPDQVGTA